MSSTRWGWGGRALTCVPLAQPACPGLRLPRVLPSVTRVAGLVHNSGTLERPRPMLLTRAD